MKICTTAYIDDSLINRPSLSIRKRPPKEFVPRVTQPAADLAVFIFKFDRNNIKRNTVSGKVGFFFLAARRAKMRRSSALHANQR